MARKLKILIVDDHALVREGIAALLKLQDDMEILGRPQTAWKLSRKLPRRALK